MQRDVVFDESMIAQTGFCKSKGVGSGFSSISSCDNEGLSVAYYNNEKCEGLPAIA